MSFPKIAPWPSSPGSSAATEAVPESRTVLTHNDLEWAALYPEIKRLYVGERRRLRRVMQYMESEHGFEATEQMYKRRFAKWGFQKNSKRTDACARRLRTDDRSGGAACGRRHAHTKTTSVPATPEPDTWNSLCLMFLTSVRAWGAAFFETASNPSGLHVSVPQPSIVPPLVLLDTKDMGIAFKLVDDLLKRGHGDLAGRLARKAFILAESILTIAEGPVLMWNLLEMMHHMVTVRHAQLFHVLLAHLTALAEAQMTKTHPLPSLLRSLRGIIAVRITSDQTKKGVSAPSSAISTTRSTGFQESSAAWAHRYPSRDLSILLERAWTVNAQRIFDHFDPRLMYCYGALNCFSCSIQPPAAILGAMDKWIGETAANRLLCAPYESRGPEIRTQGHPYPVVDAMMPEEYQELCARTMTMLRDRKDSNAHTLSSLTKDNSMWLPIMAWLTASKVLEDWPGAPGTVITIDTVSGELAHLYASNCASALEISININAGNDGGGPRAPLDAVERIRSLVTLRKYSSGEINPQVVRDMLLLQDALNALGQYQESQLVERDAHHRIELYISDVSVNLG